ncbi:hypothetical protein OIU84_023910 [Salix udensis]|uniref:Uncharacterized protein n=1 Tax=Salix udensis TaxID=889485 RepID=A0AAD6J8X4_9ROSI|nr:hypothetical protein OIU84_023910 [Salix udensis]
MEAKELLDKAQPGGGSNRSFRVNCHSFNLSRRFTLISRETNTRKEKK